MTEKNMNLVEAEDKAAEKEFLVAVQDWLTRILVMQFALSKGMRARTPRRSRTRIALQGREEDFQAILVEVRVLALLLEKRQLEMLGEFLKEHGLQVPPEVTRTLDVLEMKTAAMLGRPLPGGRSPNRGQE